MIELGTLIGEPVSHGFFVRALVAGILVGTVCAVVGTYVVLKGLAFIGDAVAHAAFPGVVAAYLLGLPIVLGFVLWNTRAAGLLAQVRRPYEGWKARGWALMNGLSGPGIGVACYQWALSTQPAALVLSIVALSPLLALLFQWGVEGQRPTGRVWVGGSLAIAGLILLAAAPCTAMVFVWSRLTNGHPLFTLSQVALNDTIMVFAFAPIVGLLLGLSSITVPWATLVTSVVLYIVIPVILAQLVRGALLKKGPAALDAALARIGPWSITALLATLVLLFAFQGQAIIDQPLVIAMLAVPILIQVLFNSALAYLLNRRLGESHNVACPSALIGASNFFELAVAAAISLFGFQSGAALATVVGVLIEVPVMLLVVRVVNQSKAWYEAKA